MKMKEFLEEKRLVSRGTILVSSLVGGFVGAVLMYFFALAGVLF